MELNIFIIITRRTNLGCGRVRNSSLFNPDCRLLIFRIVDFLGWVNWRLEIFKKATLLFALAINEDLVGIVGAAMALRPTIKKKEGLLHTE